MAGGGVDGDGGRQRGGGRRAAQMRSAAASREGRGGRRGLGCQPSVDGSDAARWKGTCGRGVWKGICNGLGIWGTTRNRRVGP